MKTKYIAFCLLVFGISIAALFAFYSADAEVESEGVYRPRVVMNSQGNPVVLFQTKSPSDLKLVVCEDPLCTNRQVKTVYHDRSVDPDPGDPNCCEGGVLSSDIALSSEGHPVVVAYSEGRFDAGVKLVICDDALCNSLETLRFPGMPADTGLQLTSKDHPVITSSGTGDVGERLASQSYICLDEDCSDMKTTGGPTLGWSDPNPYSPSFDTDSLDYQVRLVARPEFRGFYLMPCAFRDADSKCVTTFLDLILKDEVPEETPAFILRLNESDKPVITYLTTQDDKDSIFMVNCEDDRCSNHSIKNLAEESVEDIGFHAPVLNVFDFSGNLPVFAYEITSQNETIIARCNQPECHTIKKVSIPSIGLSEIDVSEDRAFVIAENFADESLKLYTIDFGTMETAVTDLTSLVPVGTNPMETPEPTPITSTSSCSTYLPTIIRD